MCTIDIRGIPVSFPFSPYKLQVDYMTKVIECLQSRQNGVLESPTGTGKTLSLLCASLAWQEAKKAQIQVNRIAGADKNFVKELEALAGSTTSKAFLGMPTIIYASRTHSQLSQAMKELKRTKYKYMKAIVLGSREQMCVNEDVVREQNNTLKRQLCRMKIKENACYYYNRTEKQRTNSIITELSVVDIEDIMTLGKKHKFCPYFMAKDLRKSADIVFTPYAYLLDPKSRQAVGLELSNSVIILDEAHNVEKMCEESASVQIKQSEVALCIDEVTDVMKKVSGDSTLDFNDLNTPKDFTAEELCDLKELFLKFEKNLDEIDVTNYSGDYIFVLFEQVGITMGNWVKVVGLLDKLVQFLAIANEGAFARKGVGLQVFTDLLQIVFSNASRKEKIKKSYKVHISDEKQEKRGGTWLSKTSKSNRVLSYWCFSAGFGMNMLMEQGVHCVVLTSGTLAPLDPLIQELELNVGVRLINPHIINEDQVSVLVLTHGPDSHDLNCKYTNRGTALYNSIGLSLANIIPTIPGGVLIFFCSYPFMTECQQLWQSNGTWSRITKTKPIFMEPRDKTKFDSIMSDYYAKIKDPTYKGAVFMGVCRGKVSEGLDFSDANGRAVFIIGIPYPPKLDPKIQLKEEYVERTKKGAGQTWYSLEAIRTVNQAIGRVIRHKNDHGAIILMDSRYASANSQKNISGWLRKSIVVKKWGGTARTLSKFFREIKANGQYTNQVERKENDPGPEQEHSSQKGCFSWTGECGGASSSGLVTIHKRKAETLANPTKKTKITIVKNCTNGTTLDDALKAYIIMMKGKLDEDNFSRFVKALTEYRATNNFEKLTEILDSIFLTRRPLTYLIRGIESFIKDCDKQAFHDYADKMS